MIGIVIHQQVQIVMLNQKKVIYVLFFRNS